MIATTADAVRDWRDWLPPMLGLAALYAPTYEALARTAWQTEEQAHGPIILALSLWLVWRNRHELARRFGPPDIGVGIAWLGAGLAAYAVGRSQDIMLLDAGSQLLVLPALALLLGGVRLLGALWFPILFLAFLVPLPGALIDALTGPLKIAISGLAEQLLYAAGYPIARHGVMLSIGQYQLLVADACSGLNSMFSLSALGLLYLYLTGHRDRWRNAFLVAAIIPVAFFANLIRVAALVLITYHAGDEAGQGFLHDFAGLAVFIVALATLLALDHLYGLARGFRGVQHG